MTESYDRPPKESCSGEDNNRRIDEYPPHKDIDQYVPNSKFRIERMREDCIWIAAYTDDDSEPDHHYYLICDGGGLRVTHRREHTDKSEQSVPDEGDETAEKHRDNIRGEADTSDE